MLRLESTKFSNSRVTFGSADGIFDIVDQSGQCQNLAFADELLGEIGFEELNFLGERTSQFGLLHALGIGQFFLAELQNLAVVEADGQCAYKQERPQHEPEYAHPSGAQACQQRL